MHVLLMLLAALWFGFPSRAESKASPHAPAYSAASILNSASHMPGPFSPNAIISLYGIDLAYATRGLAPEDTRSGFMPTVLAGTGVRVLINKLPAHIYYASPTQVNLLIPSILLPGPAELQLLVDAYAGPPVPMLLASASPALYLLAPGLAIATRADGSLIHREAPARPGDVVILYATGLGDTFPPPRHGEVPREAAWLKNMQEFALYLDGVASPPEAILYAGLAPGLPGLYLVHLRLPQAMGEDPEIRLRVGSEASPAGIRLPVRR